MDGALRRARRLWLRGGWRGVRVSRHPKCHGHDMFPKPRVRHSDDSPRRSASLVSRFHTGIDRLVHPQEGPFGGSGRMTSSSVWARVQGRYQRSAARLFFRRPFAIDSPLSIVSFTFDDFPRSALLTGGGILKRFGLAGTYYASFCLVGKIASSVPIFVLEDLKALVEEGHELGCRTFDHCH